MTKRPQRRPQANPTTWPARDDVIKALLASKLPDKTVRVLVRLAMHLNIQKGRLNPSCSTLATGSHVSERSVYRILERAEQEGLLAVERATGCQNNYVLPATTAIHMAGVTTATKMAVVDDSEPLPNRGGTTATRLADKKRKSEEREKREKQESARSARDTHETPDFDFAGKKKADAPRKAAANSGPSASGQKRKDGDWSAAERDAAFQRFWAVYPKRTAIDAARKAWARVIKNPADAETAIEAAKRYAVERRGEQPRYTRKPENFLKDGDWKDPPPDGAVIDNESGELVAYEQPQRRESREKSNVEVGRELVARIGNAYIN